MTYDKNTYVKSNSLVQSSINNFSAAQNKLMAVLLTTYVNNFESDSMIEDRIRINKYDLINYLGYSMSGRTYDDIDKTLDRFAQNSIIKWLDDRGGTNRTPIFISVRNDKLEDENCMIEFQWNPVIKPHLVDMKKEYTVLVTSNFLALKSKKSQSLYEYFHSYLNQGEITVYVDKLKELTDCTGDSYKRFCDFYRRAVTDPIDDINEKTDIHIEVVSKNKGSMNKRVIVSLTFRITNQQAKKPWFSEYPDILLTEDEYKKVTQDFYVDGLFIGKRLINKLAETKQKKPGAIHNDFKQLEKYYKAELKKHEKMYAEDTEEESGQSIQQDLMEYLANLNKGE